jgi:hypothetical protein
VVSSCREVVLVGLQGPPVIHVVNVLRPEHQHEEHDCSEPETHEHGVIAA